MNTFFVDRMIKSL